MPSGRWPRYDAPNDRCRFVVGLAADIVRRGAGLVAENALLRQQLVGAQRKIAGRGTYGSSDQYDHRSWTKPSSPAPYSPISVLREPASHR